MSRLRPRILALGLAAAAGLGFGCASALAQFQPFQPFFFERRPPPQFEQKRPVQPQFRKPRKKAVKAPAQPQKQEAKAAEAPEKADEPPPPYEKDLLRLSEIMGSLAFLRSLCNAADQAEWRTKMNALIEAEAATQARKERLAGAFNKGFRGYSLTYRRCTPSASVAIERYLVEGSRLARTISGRFGG